MMNYHPSIWDDFGKTPSFTNCEIKDLIATYNPDDSFDMLQNICSVLKHGGYGIEIFLEWCRDSQRFSEIFCNIEWENVYTHAWHPFGWFVYCARKRGYQIPLRLEASWQNFYFKLKCNGSLPLYRWSELHEFPRKKYLIKGLLEQGGMSVLFGPSNSGKTFVALDIACHVALEWEWCDLNVRSGSVVYIAGEGGLGIAERLSAFKIHHKLEHYSDVYVVPANVCLCKNESAHLELLEKIKDIEDIKLIIVDTLARAMGGGDENSSSDMGSLIQNCDIIRQSTGAHIMVIHHTGKEESRGARGHSSLKAAVDTELYVSQGEMGVIGVAPTKQRDGKKDEIFNFRLQAYEVREDEDGDSVFSCALIKYEGELAKSGLSGQAQQAYQVLTNLFIDKAFVCVPKKGMPAQNVVRLDDFKDHFIKAGIANSDNPDSMSKAFLRSKNKLKSLGYIGEWDGNVWLTDNTDNTGQTSKTNFEEPDRQDTPL